MDLPVLDCAAVLINLDLVNLDLAKQRTKLMHCINSCLVCCICCDGFLSCCCCVALFIVVVVVWASHCFRSRSGSTSKKWINCEKNETTLCSPWMMQMPARLLTAPMWRYKFVAPHVPTFACFVCCWLTCCGCRRRSGGKSMKCNQKFKRR